MSDMTAAVSKLSLGECVHILLCYKKQADPRTIGEVTEKEIEVPTRETLESRQWGCR